MNSLNLTLKKKKNPAKHNGEKLNALLMKSGAQQRSPHSTTIQLSPGSSNPCKKQPKEIKDTVTAYSHYLEVVIFHKVTANTNLAKAEPQG